MSRLDSSSLLKFLSKPRFVHEVADHFGISRKLANFHLLEAIKSGHVLVSEKPILQTLRSSNGRLKRFRGFVFVSRGSPMFADGSAKFSMMESKTPILKSKDSVLSVKFVSKTRGLLERGVFDNKLSGFAFDAAADSRDIMRRFKTEGHLATQFDVSPAKVKLVEKRTIDQLLGHRLRSTVEEAKPLSHVERIHLFQAVLKEPLPFLDLHGRFGVSKQIIRRLAKNGFLNEVWGPQAIGVRYKLSKKGEIYLKELEAAAKYESKMKDKGFIRLKQRMSS